MSVGLTKIDEGELRRIRSFSNEEIGKETRSTMGKYESCILKVADSTDATTLKDAAKALQMAAGNINFMIDDINSELDEIFKQLKEIIENEDNLANKM